MAFQLALIIVDIGGNDMNDPDVNCAEVAADLLLHLTKIMDCIPAYRRPRMVLLEQHCRRRISGPDMNYVVWLIGTLIWKRCFGWILGFSFNAS